MAQISRLYTFQDGQKAMAAQVNAELDQLVTAHNSQETSIVNLSSTTDGNSGADKVGATPITGGTANTVQGILEELKALDSLKTPIVGAKIQGHDTVAPTPVSAVGDVAWNTGRETLDVKLSSTVTGQMFQETHIYVRNTSASVIPDGTVVMRTGINADRITVAPAVCNGTVPASDILGIATEDIAVNGNGRVTVFGEINNLNTSGYAVGTELWASPTVAGGLTTTKPQAPNLKLSVAVVTKSHVNQGIILVRMNAGSELGGTDSNVQITTPADKDLLVYETATGIWKNKPAGQAGAVDFVSDQTVGGAKTFTGAATFQSTVVVPPPSADSQAATKKYVDDKALTVGDPHWKAPVANRAALPLTGNSLGDIRSVFDDGDGKQAVYECKATTGTVDQQWAKIADVDWLTEEATRVAQENARVTAEQGRVTAENGRVTAENARVSAEILRQAHITDLNNPHQVSISQIGAAATSHTHAESDITNLSSDLASKVPTNRTINGKDLAYNISLVQSDIGGVGTLLKTASFELALTDNYDLLKCVSASTITVTIPTNASVAFPIGSEIVIARYGAGAVTLSPAVGVTLYSSDSKKSINKQYEFATLKKMATDEWALAGSLSA